MKRIIGTLLIFLIDCYRWLTWSKWRSIVAYQAIRKLTGQQAPPFNCYWVVNELLADGHISQETGYYYKGAYWYTAENGAIISYCPGRWSK